MSTLNKYYRKPKAFIDLPSKGLAYDVGEKSILNEVGVMPMTMLNHLTTNNPESLINGYINEELIRDCTTITSIEPKKMFKCDVDALIMGIRMVSVDDTLDVTMRCPSCKKDNEYGINIKNMLSHSTFHEELPYKMQFGDLTLNLLPSTLETSVATEQAFFQDAKNIDHIRKLMEQVSKEEYEDGAEEVIMSHVREIYDIQRQMTETTIKLYADSIHSVETPEEVVEDRDEIYEFVKELSDQDHKVLKDKVKNINAIGIPKTHDLTCNFCQHEFVGPVELNPTDFFGNGSQ